MNAVEKLDPRQRKLVELMAEAYLYGAADSTDFYLFASQYMDVDFKEVDEFVGKHFGKDLNLSEGSPEGYKLH